MIVPQTELTAILDGREIFKQLLPPGDYVIGREAGSDIRLDANKVSRRHGQLTLNYFDWTIEDFGSSNGTWVADVSIRGSMMIFPGQNLRVGNVHLHLRRLPIDHADEMLAPQTAAVVRFLPAELRSDRKYKVNELIAVGGMGAVLAAEDLSTRRPVAMKVLLNVQTPEDIARFVEEAQITAQLEHPHIVPIYELNVNEQDKPFYTMKLVRGESLGDVLAALRDGRPGATERWPLGELIEVFQKICDAIAYAHSKGVVHRDLKPENIMLGDYGDVLVMDWGLAKALGRDANTDTDVEKPRSMVRSVRSEDGGEFMTMAGRAIGTPQFMSPEQASGRSHEVDGRADVYALGAMLYQVLTLVPPVSGSDAGEIFDQVIAGRIPSPMELLGTRPLPHLPDGKLPVSLAAVAMKALSLNPADRHRAVGELAADVRRSQFEEKRRGGLFAGWFRANA
ncbi:MAG: FHA domain-containing serine/threonine-protein kinase [Chthoniobacteraceae bacterium]